MKVEIELDYIESLKNDIKELEEQNRKLNADLNNLDEFELNQKAIKHSHELLNVYLTKIFSELGFNKTQLQESFVILPDVEYSNKNWWERKDLKIEIKAELMQKWKNAFLIIGLDTDKIKSF